MRKQEALEYLKSEKCFCDGNKRRFWPFCDDCQEKLSPQTRLDLETLTHKEWIQSLADAEIEILKAGV